MHKPLRIKSLIQHRWALIIVLTTGLGACTQTPADQQVSDNTRLLISGVTVVHAAQDSLSPPKDILIEQGTIIEIADAGALLAGQAATHLDATGLFLLPGLINVHAHIGDGGRGAQTESDQEQALAQFVRYGVTSIFVPGGGGGNDDELAHWKKRCAARELVCPDVFGSGALITAPGSHPIGTIWNLPEDVDPAIVYARGAVALHENEPVVPLIDQKVSKGVDAIKIVIEDW